MSNPKTGYAELYCLSNFSFLQAASHPEELIRRAAELGYAALAITDECSIAGVVRAWRAIKQDKLTIKLIIGAEFRVDGHPIVLLAQNNRGYTQLCQTITKARRRAEKGHYQIHLNDFSQRNCSDCLCLYNAPKNISSFSTLQHLNRQFQNRLWLVAENTLTPQDEKHLAVVKQLAQSFELPIVASNRALMHIAERKTLHDCLIAIDENKAVNDVRHLLKPNAENHLRSKGELTSIFDRNWLNESLKIAELCEFKLESIQYRYPKDTLPGQYSAREYLEILVNQGLQRRFGSQVDPDTRDTVKKELKLIASKNYEHYFLTVYDIVRFAKSQGILCQGRGSAANSIVCYALGITEVNPTEAALLFERFISESRDDPPDIDVDFEHERREEVIQYIYKRYGRKRAALAATVITYRRKSALRDVAKALGVHVDKLEQKIANYGWRYRNKNWIEEIINDGLGLSEYQVDVFKQLLQEITGFPRHLSQHVGGFVITEGVVSDLVPIENATMKDRTVIQWDKDDLEALHLMKMDVLGLGMLSAMRKTFDYVRDFTGKTLRIQDIPREDPTVFELIQKADTVGVFQIESRAQMNMLPRLKPTSYYDLVIQVAIVRPGPIHGDMVHPFLKRRIGTEPISYPKPQLKVALERTLGIPIFQEQIIRLAMIAAEFSADEANDLRRSMASWKKTGHINRLRGKLTEKMLKNGYPQEYVDRINRQIEGFGEYGFPESHAAGFALLAYISSWLKCYYPAEFCCGLLNSLPMGFYSASQLVQDARRHDVEIKPVDINISEWDSTIEEGGNGKAAIRLGLRRVKGLTELAGLSLLLHRPDGGYSNLVSMQDIPGVSSLDLESLASADALKNIAGHRFQAKWQATAIVSQKDLLDKSYDKDSIEMPVPDDFENIVEDNQSLGISLRKHILKLLREKSMIPPTPTAIELLPMALHAQNRQRKNRDEKIQVPVSVCGLITNRQMPKTATGVTFLTLEDHTGNINIIVWLPIALKYMKTLTTERLILVNGLLEKSPSNDVIHVIAKGIEGFSETIKEYDVKSRDYH